MDTRQKYTAFLHRVQAQAGVLPLEGILGDPVAAEAVILKGRWPQGPRCPSCDWDQIRPARPGRGLLRCSRCSRQFSMRTGTPLERSGTPLDVWLWAIVQHGNGVRGQNLAARILERTTIMPVTAARLADRLDHAAGLTDQQPPPDDPHFPPLLPGEIVPVPPPGYVAPGSGAQREVESPSPEESPAPATPQDDPEVPAHRAATEAAELEEPEPEEGPPPAVPVEPAASEPVPQVADAPQPVALAETPRSARFSPWWVIAAATLLILAWTRAPRDPSPLQLTRGPILPSDLLEEGPFEGLDTKAGRPALVSTIAGVHLVSTILANHPSLEAARTHHEREVAKTRVDVARYLNRKRGLDGSTVDR